VRVLHIRFSDGPDGEDARIDDARSRRVSGNHSCAECHATVGQRGAILDYNDALSSYLRLIIDGNDQVGFNHSRIGLNSVA